MVYSHHVYKSVWSPVIGEQLILEKEPAGQSTRWICSAGDKGFSESGQNYEITHRSLCIVSHKKLSSIILLGEEGKEKA